MFICVEIGNFAGVLEIVKKHCQREITVNYGLTILACLTLWTVHASLNNVLTNILRSIVRGSFCE